MNDVKCTSLAALEEIQQRTLGVLSNLKIVQENIFTKVNAIKYMPKSENMPIKSDAPEGGDMITKINQIITEINFEIAKLRAIEEHLITII